jgi:hypothetical protein
MRVVSRSSYNGSNPSKSHAHFPGIVIAGPKDLLDKRVFIVPMTGWDSAPRGPEKQYVLPSLPSFNHELDRLAFYHQVWNSRRGGLPVLRHFDSVFGVAKGLCHTCSGAYDGRGGCSLGVGRSHSLEVSL